MRRSERAWRWTQVGGSRGVVGTPSLRYEAEHLLERCGFMVEYVYADYDRSPFGSKSPSELILVARKREAPGFC